jgi:hypothetical protein
VQAEPDEPFDELMESEPEGQHAQRELTGFFDLREVATPIPVTTAPVTKSASAEKHTGIRLT